MKKFLLLLSLLLLPAIPVHAQLGNTYMRMFPGTPTGSCSPPQVAKNTATGAFYDCVAGAWTLVGSGGIAPSPTNAGSVGVGVVVASAAPYNVVTGYVSNNATFTNGSPTVTTASTDPPCTSAMVGWAIFGTKGVTGLAIASNPLTMAEGTILSCSAHSITASVNANSNSTGTAVDTLIWGPIEDTQLTAAETAAFGSGNNPCQTLVLPAGLVLVHGAHFNSGQICVSTLDGNFNVEYSTVVMGYGYHNSLIVPTPNFSFAGCGSTGCFGMNAGMYYHDWGIWGGNNSGVGLSNTNTAVQVNADGQIWAFGLFGWMGSDANFTGITAAANGQYPYNFTEDGMGATGCANTNGGFVTFIGVFCGDNGVFDLSVQSGSVNDIGSAYGPTGTTSGQITVAAASIYTATNVGVSPVASSNVLSCAATATCILHNFHSDVSAAAENVIQTAGHVIADNNNWIPGNACVFLSASTAVFDDMGGNNCQASSSALDYVYTAGAVVRTLVPTSIFTNPPTTLAPTLTTSGNGSIAVTGSDNRNEIGMATLTAGTTTGATPTVTITFKGPLQGQTTSGAACQLIFLNGTVDGSTFTGTWATSANYQQTAASSTAVTFTIFNNAASLTSTQTYGLKWVCPAR